MKKLRLLLTGLLVKTMLYAQTTGAQFVIPTVIPNTPGGASLGRYGDIPVGINTGVPNINVPIFTIKSGALSLPISINYHSAGIKVMDLPSAVGLGWSLNAGGCITRVVQGIKDEDSYGGFYSLIFPDPNDPSLAAKEKCLAANITNIYSGLQPWDGQPDLFYYSVGGKSGKFMFRNRKAKGLDPGFMTIPYAPIRIAMTGAFSAFRITDVDGTNYCFGGAYNLADTSQVQTSAGTLPPVVTGWHLAKIVSADQSDSIVFKYDSIGGSAYPVESRSLNQTYITQSTSVDYSHYSFTYSPFDMTHNSTSERLLTEIDFRNGKIVFDYSNYVLNAVHIYGMQGGSYSEIKKFVLSHSSFSANTAPLCCSYSALRLDSIQEVGVNGNMSASAPPYAFTYYSYSSYQCPPFNNYGQDLWGYFNGRTDNNDLLLVSPPTDASGNPILVSTVSSGPYTAASKRTPDSNYMKVGIIQSIRYPTGGVTTFDFEPNKNSYTHYVNDTTYQNGGGGDLSTMNAAVGGGTAYATMQFTVPSGLVVSFSPGGGSQYNVVLDFQGARMCQPGNSYGRNCLTNVPEVVLDDLTTGKRVTSMELSQLNETTPPPNVEMKQYLLLTAGDTYQLYFYSAPALATTTDQFVNMLYAYTSWSLPPIVTPRLVTDVVLTGGLRIRQISSRDGFGRSLIKQYKYTQPYYNSDLFLGSYDNVAQQVYAFQAYGKLAYPNQCAVWGLTATHYSSNTCFPIGSASNGSTSYSQVEEYQADGNGNYNGKTVYNYNQAYDQVTMNMPFYKIDKQYQRDLLKEKQTYKLVNGNYVLAEDITNTYVDLDTTLNIVPDTVSFYTAHALIDNYVTNSGSPGQDPIGGAYEGCLGCTHFTAQDSYQIGKWYYTSPRLVLKSTTKKVYDDNGNALTSTQSLDYQNPVHIFPTHMQTVSSEGKTLDSYKKYVLDYPNSNCTNTAMSDFTQGLNALKATYFPQYGILYNKYLVNRALTGYPSCDAVHPDSVTDAENAYSAAMTNFDNSVASLVNSYNTTTANYNACVANYYNSANNDQKAIMDLQAMNNIEPVLQKTEYTNNTLQSTTQTYFQTFLPNVTMPSRVMLSTQNNLPENRLQYVGYTASSRLTEVQKTGDMPVSYIWDYYGEYPVAEVKNADTLSIAFTSFEADGTGHWSFNPGAVVKGIGITGNNCFNLNSNISKSGLSVSNTYVVSYWTQSSSAFTIPGTIAGYPVKGKTVTINGMPWTYYEHKISGQSGITINGTGYIDELRLYPANAQMTTYTYTPLLGMQTGCDAGGHITYYNYDGLGRLKVVKDQDGNIIKTIEYHYQGQ